ncbi:hypothetical protein ILUMI_15883, partial [Ignelater luminosus]
ILLLSGYRALPSDDDLGCPVVKATMSRNRYLKLKSILHFQHNSWANKNKDGRGFKIRPLITKLHAQFQKFEGFDKNLENEMMIPYFGRNNFKHFIRGKPIRFGYKHIHGRSALSLIEFRRSIGITLPKRSIKFKRTQGPSAPTPDIRYDQKIPYYVAERDKQPYNIKKKPIWALMGLEKLLLDKYHSNTNVWKDADVAQFCLCAPANNEWKNKEDQ